MVKRVVSALSAVKARSVAVYALAIMALSGLVAPMADATEYTVEYKKLTEPAEKFFTEGVTAVLVVVGLILGVTVAIRTVKRFILGR